MAFILEIFKEKTLLQVYELADGQSLVFGREAKKGVEMLDDPRISRQHLCIFAEKNHLFIRDLGSTNGTLVNKTLLEAQKKYVIKDKNMIFLGKLHYIMVKEKPEKKKEIVPKEKPQEPKTETPKKKEVQKEVQKEKPVNKPKPSPKKDEEKEKKEDKNPMLRYAIMIGRPLLGGLLGGSADDLPSFDNEDESV